MNYDHQKKQQKQKKILAVDDEPDLTKLCSLALEYHGFKVDTFNDSQEALSNFRPNYYDLVILDIKMPEMDGFELYYEEFRKKEYTALDKNLFIRKPIDNEDLLKEVNKIMRSC